MFAALVVSIAEASSAGKGQASPAPALRWEDGQPGCTFSRDDDGKYRYGFWTTDFGIILAVDSQELEKVRRRARPTLSLELTVRYRGHDALNLDPAAITLEFVRHYNDRHPTLDPDALISQEKNQAKALLERTERSIRKHPGNQSAAESAMAERRQAIAQMIEFLSTRTLRPVRLDSTHPEANGWILFSTQSKWIDELKKQEELVLRVALGGRMIEFPFLLPPGEGDLLLRRRPE